MAGRPKTCIFCGEGKPTKEHVWGKWLKRHFPRNIANYRKLVATKHLTHSEQQTNTRGGDPRSLSVRCACRACNNGWMGRIQEEAAPIITPMAMGNSCVIDALSQIKIASWAAMATMTAEYDHPPNVAVSQEDRTHLFFQRHPPLTFRIWIGHIPPKTMLMNYAHHPIGIVENDAEASAHRNGPAFNHATTTQVIEQLFIHVIYGSTDIIQRWRWDQEISSLLVQIWPLQRVSVSWPPKPLTTKHAEFISAAFFNFCGDAGKRAAARRGQGR
jgi:hypothetical protein